MVGLINENRSRRVLRLSLTQLEIHRAEERHRLWVSGRRSGKTFYGVAAAVDGALRDPETNLLAWRRNVAYVFPTYKMAKRLAWSPLVELARPYTYDRNSTDLVLTLVNGSKIYLGGANTPDSLRGLGLDLAILDEFADQDPVAWLEVLRPALADRRGRGLVIGTPKGWNHFKDLYDRALEAEDWRVWQTTTEECGWVDPEELEALRREMGEREYRQEMLASFEQLAGRVYYAFDRIKNVNASLEDVGTPLEVGLDFNVDPMVAIILQRQGSRIAALDEIVLSNANTQLMADTLKRRYTTEVETIQARGPGDFVPATKRLLREVTVHPDPTCNSRKTSAKAGVTDLTILRDAGIRTDVQRVSVADRVNEVNAVLCSSSGERRLEIHPRCKGLIRALEGQTYDQSGDPDKSGGLDHYVDALGYAIHNVAPMRRRSLRPKVIRL